MPKPPRSTPERPSLIDQTLDRAVLAFQAQRPDEAARIAAEVLRSARGDLRAAQLLGQALLMQGRALAAIEALGPVARRSGDPVVETLLARALADAGRGAEADDLLRKATTRRPVYPLAFVELGDRLGKAGRFDEAAAVFEAGLALAPQAQVLRVALGYLHLQRNDRVSARALFTAVRAAAPERHDALLGLADVLARDGDHAAAADLYRQALAARPLDPTTRISLGKCLLELGERGAGEAALRAAAQGGAAMLGPALAALCATPRGRVFLRPSAAARYLRGGAG
jgi:predicted Zn-dependent protease